MKIEGYSLLKNTISVDAMISAPLCVFPDVVERSAHSSLLKKVLMSHDQQQNQSSSHLLPVQRVEPLHGPGVQLDGLGDVGQHLVEGVRRLLVQQDPHRLTRLHSAADHRHQFGFDEVFALSALPDSFGALFGDDGGGRRHPGCCSGGSGPAGCTGTSAGAGFPARDGDLGVVDLPVGFVRSANVALT